MEALSGVNSAGHQMEQMIQEGRKGSRRDGDRHPEARGDRPRPPRPRERGRPRHQDRQSHPRTGPQGKSLRYPHRALRENPQAPLPRRWRPRRGQLPPQGPPAPIASRIKILAGLDIAERRLPQDGRFRIRVSGKEVDLRISRPPHRPWRENRHPSPR